MLCNGVYYYCTHSTNLCGLSSESMPSDTILARVCRQSIEAALTISGLILIKQCHRRHLDCYLSKDTVRESSLLSLEGHIEVC